MHNIKEREQERIILVFAEFAARASSRDLS